MEAGQKLKAKTFDGRYVECRLVEIRGNTAIVCGEAEWEKSIHEQREPQCLGWPLSHVRESGVKSQKASRS
jgi:hypothetical protein